MSVPLSSDSSLSKEELLLRLEEAEETLRAIRSGEVDALVVSGEQGDQVFTLKDATLPYQVLIEEMNEGALTLSHKGLILYCNARFAEMLGMPMQTIMGQSFLDYVSLKDQVRARGLLEQRLDGKSTGELILKGHQIEIPVGISLKEIRLDGELRLGVVVSDLTERKRAELQIEMHRQHLEELVTQRTAQLELTNTQLLVEISERRQAEDHLERSNQKLNETLLSIQDDFYVLDRNWNFVYASKLFTSKVGKEPEDFIGYNIWKMFPKYVGTVLEENFRVAMEKREVRRFEISGKYTSTWYRMTAFPSPEGITVLGTDITERRQAEMALQEVNKNLKEQAVKMERQSKELQSARLAALNLMDDALIAQKEVKQINDRLREGEQRLRRAQEIAHLGSWELDLLTNQLSWSDEVYRIFGLQPREFGATYEAFLGAVHPDDRATVDQAYADSIRDQKDSYEIEHRVIRRSNGEIRYLHEKCEHFRNEDGQVIRSVGIVHDITERKQAEEALRRFELLSEHSRDIILFMRRQDGCFLEVNQAAIQAYGYSHEEFLALAIQDLRANDNSNLTAKQMALADAGGILFETVHQRKDGSTFPVEVSSQGANIGGVRTLVNIVRDITERKRAEERLQQLNRTLKALSNTNQAMIRATSERQLLDDVCKIMVDDCGHSMVWIGYAKEDEKKSVKPVASAGFEAGYLETLNISWGDNDRGRGPTGTAIRTGKPGRCNNMLTDPLFAPWREQAIKRGYASSLVLPLIIEDKVFGTITIYSHEPNSFSTEEEALLTKLAGDLAYGIQAIRLQEAHALAETELRRARDELEIRVQERTEELAAANEELSDEIAERKEIERQLRIQTAAMEAAANGILITDPKGLILWTNPAVTQISGYEDLDLVGHSTHIFNSGRHEAGFYQQMWATILAGNVWRGETTNRRKDGSLYIEEQTITPVLNDDDQLSHFIAIKQDVTERKMIHARLEESNRELKTLSDSERQQRFLAEGLVESSVVLNMSLELHAVLDRIFEQTRRIIPYLTADIVLIEGDVATVVRQWWTDEYFEARTIFENDTLKIPEFPIWERICTTKSAVMVPDTESETQWGSYFGMNWVRSYLGAPLIYNDQIVGIINLISDQANTFQEDMVKTLQAFAAPAAVAIQNARLYENEQQNRKVAEILSAASVALAQTLDTQMVMETTLDYMQFVMPLEVAFVVLNEGDERYRIRAVRTGDDNLALRNSLLDQSIDMLSEPIIRSYFPKHESMFIPDSRALSPWNPTPALEGMNCWLGIPLESMGKLLGLVVIAHTIPNTFIKNQILLAEAVVKQAVVALQNAWLFEQVRSGRERLQQLSRHLVEIQENERKYIARELHDETSQSLTSLKMGLQVIEREADRRVRLAEQVRNLQSLADETLESLHHLAVNLRPASLDHLGLADALTSLIESTKQRSGLQAHFKIIGSMQMADLKDEIETSIYRIVQESITNVIRHAHATYVDVILEWQDEKILIVIEDDGVGMDMQKARETGRLGLIGMQERAEMLGGRLLVDSTPDVGTTLVVEIPYANSNPNRR